MQKYDDLKNKYFRWAYIDGFVMWYIKQATSDFIKMVQRQLSILLKGIITYQTKATLFHLKEEQKQDKTKQSN